MPRGNCLDCLYTFRSDKSPSPGERLETALKSKSHAFQQASMGDIRKGILVQNAANIGKKAQSSRDLSHAAKEDSRAGDIRIRSHVLWVTRVANDCFGAMPPNRSEGEARLAAQITISA